jgi:hypothetical protein
MKASAQQPASGVSRQAERALLADIGRLGGDDRLKGAQGALDVFHTALFQLVKENPADFGAGSDAASQERIVGQLMDSVRTSFLSQTVTALRRKAGYVNIMGYWIHRAVFTFLGFGILLAVVLPLCAVSLMSTAPWGWMPGAAGLLAGLLAGAWILSRIRTG